MSLKYKDENLGSPILLIEEDLNNKTDNPVQTKAVADLLDNINNFIHIETGTFYLGGKDVETKNITFNKPFKNTPAISTYFIGNSPNYGTALHCCNVTPTGIRIKCSNTKIAFKGYVRWVAIEI